MKKFFYGILGLVLLTGCGGKSSEKTQTTDSILSTETTSIGDDSAEAISSNDSFGKNEDIAAESATENKNKIKDKEEPNKYDTMLSQYESAANGLRAASKKVMSGDESAWKKVSIYGPKCDSFEKKLNKAKSNLTPAQKKRFEQIKSKHWNAAGSIAG